MKKLRLNKTTLRDLDTAAVSGRGVITPTISGVQVCCETIIGCTGYGPVVPLPSFGGPSGCVACMTK